MRRFVNQAPLFQKKSGDEWRALGFVGNMASNRGRKSESESCVLCELTGQFEVTERDSDPIVEMVKAAEAKFIPWDAKKKGNWKASDFIDSKDLDFTTLSSKLDALWQTENFIDLRQDEIAKPTSEKERSAKAEDLTKDIVR